jgi:hypothetical protein
MTLPSQTGAIHPTYTKPLTPDSSDITGAIRKGQILPDEAEILSYAFIS